jgi:hypothetical protein
MLLGNLQTLWEATWQLPDLLGRVVVAVGSRRSRSLRKARQTPFQPSAVPPMWKRRQPR